VLNGNDVEPQEEGKMRKVALIPIAGGLTAAGLATSTIVKFYRGRSEAERRWNDYVPRHIEQPGTVANLSVLPLIDYYTADDTLVGEAGVSYLVKADDTTILFDLGENEKRAPHSPLVHNMEALGVSRDAIDAVVISHRHIDHTGGFKAQKAKTFMLSPDDTAPLFVPAYVPEEMTHPTAEVKVVTDPVEIAPGVFSTGTIARSIWLLGLTPEQALAVNVEGKGIVLIMGCGHQTLERAIERTESLLDAPLYGVIGGLHLPVTGSRAPYGLQRYIGTGRPPWQRIGKDDVRATVEHLKEKDPKLVAISAHDSCDWTLGEFREAFGDRYRDVIVGREIVV
jgi:7,8-dihydropterin-6-yl-methyl-4-(beta-D-ribofuranosyl)aminobenzene 5'-phosphate synthase